MRMSLHHLKIYKKVKVSTVLLLKTHTTEAPKHQRVNSVIPNVNLRIPETENIQGRREGGEEKVVFTIAV